MPGAEKVATGMKILDERKELSEEFMAYTRFAS
jgi:hypothetical protein